MKKHLFLLPLLVWSAACRTNPPPAALPLTPLAEHLMHLERQSAWELKRAIPLDFDTHHRQGLVKIDDNTFVLSSVEVIRWPKRVRSEQGERVLDEGEGIGHLFKFDSTGTLLAEMRLDEGAAYHPGGIDYDGRWIWVPVTRYYPYSQSIVYRVDPQTMEAEEVLRVDDSIGAIIHDTDHHTLIGANWDAREFLRWTLDAQGRPTNAGLTPQELRTPNAARYIAAQDAQYLGGGLMFCSGLQVLRQGETNFYLGGFEVISTLDLRPVRQVPVQLFTPSGGIMTSNPCAVEATPDGVRAYFVPEDNRSTLYVYEAVTE